MRTYTARRIARQKAKDQREFMKLAALATAITILSLFAISGAILMSLNI